MRLQTWIWNTTNQPTFLLWGSSANHCATACVCPYLTFPPLAGRRWARLVTKAKGTTWTSGRCCAVAWRGGARRPCVSATGPLRRYCPWPASSMGGPFTARWRCTPCRGPASTACGGPWRASSWSPARARQAAAATATRTPSSDWGSPSSPLLSVSVFLSVCLSAGHRHISSDTCTSSLSAVTSHPSHLSLPLTFLNLFSEATTAWCELLAFQC